MTHTARISLSRLLLALATGLCLAGSAQAEEGRHRLGAPANPQYQQECAACHVAYPPGLLPASSWQDLMTKLPHHFGTDASLDGATTKQLTTWLMANGGSGRRAKETPAENRITRSAWFSREHDEVAPSTWKRSAIKSPANCAACHPQAEKGEFNEHDIRIPR